MPFKVTLSPQVAASWQSPTNRGHRRSFSSSHDWTIFPWCQIKVGRRIFRLLNEVVTDYSAAETQLADRYAYMNVPEGTAWARYRSLILELRTVNDTTDRLVVRARRPKNARNKAYTKTRVADNRRSPTLASEAARPRRPAALGGEQDWEIRGGGSRRTQAGAA